MGLRTLLSPEMIYPLLDRFIPPALRADRETYRRARIFLVSHFFGPFLGHTITIYLFWLDPHPGYGLGVLASAITVYWAFPFLLKCTGALTALALISVANLVFMILWGCYHYGGVSSPFFGWLVVVPLLAFLYLDSLVPRLTVMGMITAGIAFFYFFFATAHSFPEHVPLSALSGIGIVSITSAAIYVSMMALYYATMVASHSELEHEVRNHRATALKLSEAKEEAENADRAKSEFLAKMSHELRTPLNAVIGYSEMLLEDFDISGGDEQGREDLARINSSGKHLLEVISDVLDISKIEAGKMELLKEHFDLDGLVDELVAIAQPLCARNGNRLVVHRADSLGQATGDVTKLRKAALNLLSNAAKFTKEGRVSMGVVRESGQGGDWLRISVRDTGIGIARENLGKLFQNFSQAEAGISTKYGGTGLGLALTQKLCRLMGGDVTVESELGQGSCFTMRLPDSADKIERQHGVVDGVLGFDYRNDPILGAALAYWRRQRGPRAMPRRRDIDPTVIPKLLPHLQLIEVLEDGARFRYRLVGTALVAAFGREYTGKYLDELFTGERLAHARRVYLTVCAQHRAVFLSNRYSTTRDLHMIANRLYMPLSDDGRSVNIILGALTFEWGRGAAIGMWAGARLDPSTAALEIVDDAEPAALPA
ncbi:MAG: ATP-binding protein [Stellaceae bacterium]